MAKNRDEHREPVIRAFVALPGETQVEVSARTLPGSGLCVYTQMIISKTRRTMKNTLAVLLSILSVGYLIPTTIAIMRSRSNTGSIFVVNLFLGWTLIGWVVALAWSVATDKINSVKQIQQ